MTAVLDPSRRKRARLVHADAPRKVRTAWVSDLHLEIELLHFNPFVAPATPARQLSSLPL